MATFRMQSPGLQRQMTAAPLPRNAPAAPAPLLSVRHLRIPRGSGAGGPLRAMAIEDFHLDQREGEVVAVVGEADSGASELATALAGRRAGVSGSVRYDGVEQLPGKPQADCALIAPKPFNAISKRNHSPFGWRTGEIGNCPGSLYG